MPYETSGLFFASFCMNLGLKVKSVRKFHTIVLLVGFNNGNGYRTTVNL